MKITLNHTITYAACCAVSAEEANNRQMGVRSKAQALVLDYLDAFLAQQQKLGQQDQQSTLNRSKQQQKKQKTATASATQQCIMKKPLVPAGPIAAHHSSWGPEAPMLSKLRAEQAAEMSINAPEPAVVQPTAILSAVLQHTAMLSTVPNPASLSFTPAPTQVAKLASKVHKVVLAGMDQNASSSPRITAHRVANNAVQTDFSMAHAQPTPVAADAAIAAAAEPHVAIRQAAESAIASSLQATFAPVDFAEKLGDPVKDETQCATELVAAAPAASTREEPIIVPHSTQVNMMSFLGARCRCHVILYRGSEHETGHPCCAVKSSYPISCECWYCHQKQACLVLFSISCSKRWPLTQYCPCMSALFSNE